MIPFNVPPCVGDELDYVKQAIDSHKICGDGAFTKQCNAWLEERFHAQKVLLTTSGTTALDMAMLLCDIHPGDEVILPSFTFSSTATAAVLAGAKLVFVDIRPDTMNIDETKIEQAITDKTRVIIAMHYAGVACEMDTIMDIARRHDLKVVEDAAQGVMSSYKGKALGTIGDFGCYSFHETKNYSMGEGGALVINNPAYNERAEILREKGTNRAKFFRGQVDKYTWSILATATCPVTERRLSVGAAAPRRRDQRQPHGDLERLPRCLPATGRRGQGRAAHHPGGLRAQRPHVLPEMQGSGGAHRADPPSEANDILAVFHYIPLHSAPAGKKFGRFDGADVYTTAESERLVRLPMYYGLTEADRNKVIAKVLEFYAQ